MDRESNKCFKWITKGLHYTRGSTRGSVHIKIPPGLTKPLHNAQWDFWQSNKTELMLLLFSRNFLVIKGGNAKVYVTAFSSYHVLSTRALSCNREGVYLYEHFKITKRYKNYHFFSRNQ